MNLLSPNIYMSHIVNIKKPIAAAHNNGKTIQQPQYQNIKTAAKQNV